MLAGSANQQKIGRRMKSSRKLLPAAAGLVLAALVAPAFADGGGNGGSGTCASLPGWSQLRQQLSAAIGPSNGGLGFNMWATIVANDGTVCAVAFSGSKYTDQWLGSRVISAQKASTANDFSLSNGAQLHWAACFPPVSRCRPPISTQRCNRAAAFTGCSTAIRLIRRSRTRATRSSTARRRSAGRPARRRR